MGAIYQCYNGPMQTTSSPSKVTTGTAIKTMLQLSPKTGCDLKIKSWWISFDGSAAATPGIVELIETDVAGTVTAFASADITKLNNPGGPAADSALITLGTSNSGYTCTSEGSITTVRNLDGPYLIAPTNEQIIQFVLGNEPILQAGKFLRIRVNFAAAINCLCGLTFEG